MLSKEYHDSDSDPRSQARWNSSITSETQHCTPHRSLNRVRRTEAAKRRQNEARRKPWEGRGE